MLIATDADVHYLDTTRRDARAEALWQGAPVACVAEGKGCRVVVLVGGEVRARAGRKTRRMHAGIPEPICSLLILRVEPLDLLVGTEEARLYRLTNDGPAERVESFDELECRRGWHTPWGGPPAVRSLARSSDGWVYADIHVGSIMRSPDGGHSWEPVRPDLDEDVHQVATSAAAPARVYANTARGVYVSEDHGEAWLGRAADLGGRYGRAVAVHPHRPDVVLASVSDGPHGDDVHAGLFRSTDAGRTWRHVVEGFPATSRDNIDTFAVGFSGEGVAWAIAGNTLYRGSGGGARWRRWWSAGGEIRMISCG